jgi:tetratricopeptide (TPR) repeat protein
LPTAAIVGGAIGIGALVGGITLMLLGGGSKPASAQPVTADKPVERSIARTEDPHPTQSPTTPVKPNPAPAPPPAVVIPPRDDEESRAATAFEAMKKRVEGELKEDKDGQLAAIDEYLGKYGEAIAATRARILKEEIQNPKPRAQARAPTQTTGNVPKLTDAQRKDLVDRTGDMLRSGDAAGCMAECDKVLSQHPDFAELYVNRAAAHRMLGEFEEMLPDLDMAEKHHYALWQVSALRAVVYYAMHKDRDAVAQLAKAKSLITEPAKLQSTWLAEVARDRAIYDGKQLEGKSINTAQEYVARGIFRLIVKKYDEGSSDLEAALKLDAKTAPAVFTALASSAQGRKDWKARLVAYRRWSEATPDSPEALNSYAWELLTSEDTSLRDAKAALPAAEKSNKLCGEKNWGVLDTLALAQFRNGNFQDAVDLEKKAIGLLPAETAAATRKEYNDHLAEFEAGLKSIK